MRALRIMTWNVRLFSAQAAAIQGISHTAPEDATTIGGLITALAVNDPPDIIAFNEVYDDKAAQTLGECLKPFYPHSLKTFGSAGVSIPPKLDDSGLMIVSRFPFLARPGGGHFEFRSYDEADGDDALSDKGVGLVQIDNDGETVTVAFTHLQASYDDDNSEHSGTRSAQLDAITSLLREVLGDPEDDRQQWRHVVVMGDLNVRGDRWAPTRSGRPCSRTRHPSRAPRHHVVRRSRLAADHPLFEQHRGRAEGDTEVRAPWQLPMDLFRARRILLVFAAR